MKNNYVVKFFTRIPTLASLMLMNLITPEAVISSNIGIKTKKKKMKYQTSTVTKPGPKRSIISVLEELLICLVRLRLGLMGRKLADIFSVSQAQVSRIFTTHDLQFTRQAL